MEANRIARLKHSAVECAEMAIQTQDPRAKAVLATAAVVWAKLASQQTYDGEAKQVGDLVDLLDTALVERAASSADR
jgi:hypothetical protein